MKENDSDSDDIIINTSSKEEKINIFPSKIISDISENPNQKASIENISRTTSISESQPKKTGNLGQKGTILFSKEV